MYPFKAYNSVVGEDTFAYVAVYYKFRLSAVTAGVCNKRRVNLYEFDGDICCVQVHFYFGNMFGRKLIIRVL